MNTRENFALPNAVLCPDAGPIAMGHSSGWFERATLRRWIKLSLSIALAAVVLFPAVRTAQAAEPTFAAIRQAGVLRCGAALAPPYVVRDAKTGAYSGAFADLCRDFGEHVLKVKVTFVDTTWDNMIAGLQTDKWDFAMAINRTPVREQVIDFSTAVVQNAVNFVYNKSNSKLPKHFTTVADLDKPGIVFAVVAGTADDKAITPVIKQAQIMRLPDGDGARLAVISRRADLMVDESDANLIFRAAHPDWAVIFNPQPAFNQEDVSFGLTKNWKKADLDQLNAYIEGKKKSGFVTSSVQQALKAASTGAQQ
jgi:polar amino acid transport system substrate-binding protein